MNGVRPTRSPTWLKSCTGNDDATEWTCTLKQGVTFSNGATFDANDVVATMSAGLDFNSPFRKGNTGTYQYFKDLLLQSATAINEPPAAQ